MDSNQLDLNPPEVPQISSDADPELGIDRRHQSQEKRDAGVIEHHTPAAELQVGQLDTLKGWRFWVTTACLLCGLFLSGLESSIIATALVSISEAFQDSQRSNWIVASYFITYTGFLIIFARLSDLFGRKSTLVTAITIFTTFSAACGDAQTMTQLIILRAFQGMGGAGLYSLAMSITPEVTPWKYMGLVLASYGPCFVIASLLGPVLGGVIATHTSWRWIFFLNVPIGVLLLCVVALVFPANNKPLPIRWRTLSFIDFPGMVLSLLGVVTIIYAIERAGLGSSWGKPAIIAPIVAGAVALIGFVTWEKLLSAAKVRWSQMLPLLPINLFTTRVIGSVFLTAFITGFPFMMILIFLPQRFQLQNGLSPLDTGIRMLPLLVSSATGAAIAGIITMRKNITWYMLLFSVCLQMLGLGLMITLPTTGEIYRVQYAYQALLGLGFGCTMTSYIVLMRVEVGENGEKDAGAMTGAITQIRILGGLIGIAIGQAVISTQVTGTLSKVLSPKSLEMVLSSPDRITRLPADEKDIVVRAYGDAFNTVNKIAIGLCGVALVACVGGMETKAFVSC
ncbi:phospho-2-dehydro-3-deoxyheptonate aldolase- phenylalanine-inhibited [Apiospora arundinis]